LLKTKEFYAITKETQIAFGVESNQMIIALLYKGCDSVKRRSVSYGNNELVFSVCLLSEILNKYCSKTNGT
jgi:hypothetical protein